MATGGPRRPTRDVARAIQRRLEAFYLLESAVDVLGFIRTSSTERETLLVKEAADGVELALVLPEAQTGEHSAFDHEMQIVEGVSHFVYVCSRAKQSRPTTMLELELQAEVDKFVWLLLQPDAGPANEVHQRLYSDATFLHEAQSEEGHRYRLANRLAAKLVRRVLRRGSAAAERELRRFYRLGQREKIRSARAA